MPVPADARSRAEALFNEGLRLGNVDGDWKGALAAFKASREAFPTRSATRNAAVALRHLGKFAEAYELYTSLLLEFSAVLSAEEVGSVETDQRALLQYLGTLEIGIQEPGVELMVDGQKRGVTPLDGPLVLDVGKHTLRLSKSGFEPLETRAAISAGTVRTLDVALRPLSTPAPSISKNASEVQQPPLGLHLEASLGLLLARSLRGSVDEACDCDARARPLGWLGTLRVGYALAPHFAAELSAGYMSLEESSRRSILAHSTEGKGSFVSDDYRDAVFLHGALLGVAFKAAAGRRTPFSARLGAGLAWLNTTSENGGNFRGTGLALAGTLSVDEPKQELLAPWVSTELRYGYRFGRYLDLDLGVSLLLFVPPQTIRANRWGPLDGSAEAIRKAGGVVALPDEPIVRAFLAVSPSLAARITF